MNCSEVHQFADDLTRTEYLQIQNVLAPEYSPRIEWADRVAVGWLERRTEQEMFAYPDVLNIAIGVVREGLSGSVTHPGVTTCDDVAWWMRQRTHDLGLDCWFMPYVKAQRRGVSAMVSGDAVIRPGDALHCDFGLRYLGLCTDTKQHAYCLRPGEVDAPTGLTRLLTAGQRVQEILASILRPGVTGNAVLAATLAGAAEEGIRTKVYAHPIGFHGHAAGTYIGLADMQKGVPGTGDYDLHDDTAYSFELNVTGPVAEWDNQLVTLPIESDVVFVRGEVHYLPGRQESFHLVG